MHQHGTLLLRPFNLNDIEPLCIIEARSRFAPWSRNNILEAFSHSLNTLLVASFITGISCDTDKTPGKCTREADMPVTAQDLVDAEHLLSAGKEVVAGYICFRILCEELYILKVAVHPEFRRNGIATALLSRALHMGQTADAEKCVLETDRDNTPALALYKKLGFTLASESGNDSSPAIMVKSLSKAQFKHLRCHRFNA